MVSIVLLINGQKKLIPLTSDVGSGVPLGTLVAFSDDTPKDGYVQMGTTFDETKYPMLFAMRGSNVLPAMFDHSRLGDYETITLPNTEQNAIIMDYDGFVYADARQSATNGLGQISIFVNGIRHRQGNDQQGAYTGICSNIVVPFKKGDSVYYTQNDSNPFVNFYVRYYTHPLFIKATSGLSENQQENVLNILNNNLSYSTEEHATGRKWIDGKMIYECTVTGSITNGTELITNCDKIIGVKGFYTVSNEQYPIPFGSQYSYCSVKKNTSNKIVVYSSLSSSDTELSIEYTKTTQ